MVRNYDAVELHLRQGLHHLEHIHIAVIHKSLAEFGQWRTHISEMDFENLLLRAEGADCLCRTFAKSLLAPFGPRADAQTYPEVVAAGNLEGALIRGVRPEGAGDASQRLHWRIIRVQPDPHLVLLRHWNNGADKRG